MGRFFIPRQWRLPYLVAFLMVFELPFTVANLALFGIASPNLYRTILWREGGRMGFNSDPSTIVYAYANYQPLEVPLVWSGYNTQYHLVIGVVCMFFLLVKATLWLLKVFYPIFSVLLHIALLSLWAYGIHIQTAPDTIDPLRPNNGAPWYITKSCNIVEDKTIRGYCMQAKSSFAVSVIMLTTYALFLLLSLFSLYPTQAEKASHAQKQLEKQDEKEKFASALPSPSIYDNNYNNYNSHMSTLTPEQQWQHMWELQQLPRSPGPRSPITPRTMAFRNLEGGSGNGNGNGHGNGINSKGGVIVSDTSADQVERDDEGDGNGNGNGIAYAYSHDYSHGHDEDGHGYELKAEPKA